MASTNKTTHYELDQYVSTDKPTYLGDFNGDMLKIDNGIYAAQQKADSAYTLADSADGKADNATLTANAALTNAGTANTNIGTMANLDTTDKTSIVGAVNEVNGKISNFNLTTYNTYNNSDFTFTNCTGVTGSCEITVAKNSDGSLAKIYGRVFITKSSAGGASAKITSTLAPDSEFTINPIGIMQHQGNKNIWSINATVKTNGEIVFNFPDIGSNTDYYAFIQPCLYFVKDFGDVPVQ